MTNDKGNTSTSETTRSKPDPVNTYLARFISDPTNFNGDVKHINPLIWLEKLQRIKEIGSLDDKSILIITADHLTDNAGRWFAVTYPDISKITWEEFKQAFMSKYCVAQEDVWWEEINKLKQQPGDTVEDVEIKIREIYQLLNVKNERLYIHTFLNAINPTLALEVERAGINSDTKLNDVVKMAVKAELFLNKYSKKNQTLKLNAHGLLESANVSSSASSTSSNNDDVKELIKEFKELKVNMLNATKSNNYKSNSQGLYNSNKKNVFTCYLCKQEGHKKSECPQRNQQVHNGQSLGKDQARQ